MAQILIALKNQKRVGYFLFFHSQNCLMKTKGSHITHNSLIVENTPNDNRNKINNF